MGQLKNSCLGLNVSFDLIKGMIMKFAFALMFLFASLPAFCASVKITSFNLIRIGDSLNHPVAELCGKVEGSTKMVEYLKVTVDAGSRRPGHYNTIADDKGNFCLTVVTYRGNAEVRIIGDHSSLSSAATSPLNQ
jgi:hypothetical protein